MLRARPFLANLKAVAPMVFENYGVFFCEGSSWARTALRPLPRVFELLVVGWLIEVFLPMTGMLLVLDGPATISAQKSAGLL